MEIILYGSGSPLIVDFVECCYRANIEINGIVRNYDVSTEYITDKKFFFPDQLSSEQKKLPFLVPLFTPKNRFFAYNDAIKQGLTVLNILYDPHVILPTNFTQGAGCFINTGVVLGSHITMGEQVIINRGATLGHHLTLADFVSIGPGVNIGGNVKIGRGSMIGVGATILPKINIGQHAIVGGGAVVTKDVPDFTVVVGNPARPMKQGIQEDGF